MQIVLIKRLTNKTTLRKYTSFSLLPLVFAVFSERSEGSKKAATESTTVSLCWLAI